MKYIVKSSNFDYHPALPADTFAEALAAAKARGFEARIESGSGALLATWSPLFGVHKYDGRAIAALESR